jgi:hypothetical protein
MQLWLGKIFLYAQTFSVSANFALKNLPLVDKLTPRGNLSDSIFVGKAILSPNFS